MTRWRRYLLYAEFTILLLLGLASAASTFARSPRIVPAGHRFTCTADRVWDGDGPIWCIEGIRVRLARINTRELDGSCRRRAPCPLRSGTDARAHLAALLGGPVGRSSRGHVLVRPVRLACLSDGWGKGDRTAAWCERNGVDLSSIMIRDGYAAAWPDAHPH